MTPADRQRAYRERQRRGLATYLIDLEAADFAALIYAGLLDPKAALQPRAVRAAASAALRDWRRRTYPFR